MKDKKKIFAVSAALCSVLFFTGCEDYPREYYTDTSSEDTESINYQEQAETAKVSDIENNKIYIITDHKTGVQYIVYRENL